MRTKHMDQHLNSGLLTLGCPRMQQVPEYRGCRDLPGLSSFAENQDLHPGCQPSPSSGHSGLILPTVMGDVGEVSGENGQGVPCLPCYRAWSSVRGFLRVSGCPCRSSQNLLLSCAQPSTLPHSPSSNPSVLAHTLLSPPSPESPVMPCAISNVQGKQGRKYLASTDLAAQQRRHFFLQPYKPKLTQMG